MPRFFRRLAEGIFDEKDLIERTHELHEFVNQAADDYQFDRSNVVAIGYLERCQHSGKLIVPYS